jgi:hypothetical protein
MKTSEEVKLEELHEKIALTNVLLDLAKFRLDMWKKKYTTENLLE